VLGDALERLAADGPAPFYTGDIAAAVVERLAELGGTLTLADLGAYEAVAREPVRVRYRGREVLTNPPPSAGGTLLAYALALLDSASPPPSETAIVAGDGAGAGRAHAGLPGGPRRPEVPRALHGQPARLDDAHLRARHGRLGLHGHVHQRRGLLASSCPARASTSTT
jgi:hypothetical protein